MDFLPLYPATFGGSAVAPAVFCFRMSPPPAAPVAVGAAEMLEDASAADGDTLSLCSLDGPMFAIDE